MERTAVAISLGSEALSTTCRYYRGLWKEFSNKGIFNIYSEGGKKMNDKERRLKDAKARQYVLTLFWRSLLFAIGCSILMCSCTDRWIINKAQKRGLILRDTVVTYDTVIVEVNQVDTLFKYNYDTVEYWQDSVYVKYHYDTLDETVYIEVDCPDCEEITKTVKLPPVLVKPSFWEKLEYIGGGVLLLGFVLSILWLFRKN
ncbi:MAG: hypothetical protein NXI20_17760 [bacterium]|nr:hypothetical protein [bacterium]